MTPEVVLILGASGQLGKALQEVFVDKVVLAPTSDYLNLASDGFKWMLREYLRETTPDVIINCAAFHKLWLCEENAALAFEVNACAVGEIAKAAAVTSIPFVHISTDYALGYRPLNVYGVTKLAGEHLAINANPKTTIVRTAGLYGPDGMSGKGPHFLERVLQKAEAREPFHAVSDVYFSPSYAPFVASAIRMMLEYDENQGEVCIAGSGCTSWYEFAMCARYMAFSGTAHEIGPLESVLLSSLREPFDRPRRPDIGHNKRLMPKWEDGVAAFIQARSKRKGNLCLRNL